MSLCARPLRPFSSSALRWCCIGLLFTAHSVFAQSLFHQANANITAGELETAVQLIQSDQGQSLTDEEVRYLMSAIYAQIGQRAKAEQLLNGISQPELASLVNAQRLELAATHASPAQVKRLLADLDLEDGDDAQLKYLALAAMNSSGHGSYLKRLKAKALEDYSGQFNLDLAWVYFHIGAYAEVIKTLNDGPVAQAPAAMTQRAHWLARAYGQLKDKPHACQSLHTINSLKLTGAQGELDAALNQLYGCASKQVSKPPHPSPPPPQPHLRVSEPAKPRGAASDGRATPSPAVAEIKAIPRADATPGLTLRPQGAFNGQEQKVSYYDRRSSRLAHTLPIPASAGITGASGILIGGGHYVLTNRHVVEGGQYFAVKSALGGTSKAHLVKISDTSDLALLQLEDPFADDQSISASEITNAKAGSQIYSMGYPLWYLLGSETPSITNGLVAKNSGLNDDPRMFQITAKVNKGNSGGPVFDQYGRLVGLTTGKLDTENLRRTEGVAPEGVNFIYQAKEIMSFAGQTIEQGQAHRLPQQPLKPEQLYESRLGSAVMVAVGR